MATLCAQPCPPVWDQICPSIPQQLYFIYQYGLRIGAILTMPENYGPGCCVTPAAPSLSETAPQTSN